MNTNKLFKDNVEYQLNNVIDILKDNNQFSVTLFFNCYGWNTYYTTEPTGCTPTGVLYKEGFPAKVRITMNYNYTEHTIKPIKFLK